MSNNETNINFLFKNKYAKLIEHFISNQNQEFYVNELLNKLEISPQVLCESLKELESAQILTSIKKANSIYYKLNQNNDLVKKLKTVIKPITYKDAGVNIDQANLAVNKIKKYVKSTYTKGVLSNVGSFGGLFELDNNVLVSSTDGVGTKLKIAYLTNIHNTIGQDLVNHCVNDILVMGAQPLFFLDYIGSGKVQPEVIEQIVKGISIACKENNTSLIAGEIAEMPNIYKKDEYDLASFIVGKVKKEKIISGKNIKLDDTIIGLSSNGLHTNGYSLAIKILLEINKLKLNEKPKELTTTLQDALLKIHISYLKPINNILKKHEIKGMAHITGGGLIENIPRILPNNLNAEINKDSWKTPEIFNLIKKLGHVPEDEMFRVFNMGIGFIIIINKEDETNILEILKDYKFKSQIIGKIKEGNKKVILKHSESTL